MPTLVLGRALETSPRAMGLKLALEKRGGLALVSCPPAGSALMAVFTLLRAGWRVASSLRPGLICATDFPGAVAALLLSCGRGWSSTALRA